MTLGRQLVEELQLEPSVDTLGRWMAHHLAELMMRAESANDPAERADATNRVVDTILRVWEHRSSYRQISPLADLEKPLGILRVLAQETPPWGYATRGDSDDAARRAYDLLRRLTICLSLEESGDVEETLRGLARSRLTSPWQSKDELEIVEHLSRWVELSSMEAGKRQNRSPHTVNDATQSTTPLDIAELASQILEEIEEAVVDLRQRLQSRG